MNREQLRSNNRLLHVITDFHHQQRHSHAELTCMALDGGADMIQFRHKSVSVRPFMHEAGLALSAFRAWKRAIPHDRPRVFLVNDRVDVALAIGADGVHVGQSDLPADVVRRMIGPDRILGVTATTLAQCIRAEADGADYIGFGPVYPTRSKDNPASIKGLEGLHEAAQSVSIPVLAIAGITPERCGPVMDTGAGGVAVMSSVVLATHPTAAAREFRIALDR
ncbi:MAG: thiamine phosphate synthase [Rhodothermales bacterium]